MSSKRGKGYCLRSLKTKTRRRWHARVGGGTPTPDLLVRSRSTYLPNLARGVGGTAFGESSSQSGMIFGLKDHSNQLTGQSSKSGLFSEMARSSACLDFLLLLLSSDSIAFPFYFFSFLARLRGFVSPPDVHWRRNVCSRGGDVLSAVVGFIPIRGSNNDKRPVVGRIVATSTSRNLIRNGGLRTRLLSQGLCAAKGKVRDALLLQAVLPSATSRLRAAQRGFRPKMARAAEIVACKFHKP